MIKKTIILPPIDFPINHKSQELDKTIKYALAEELMDKRSPWWLFDIYYQ